MKVHVDKTQSRFKRVRDGNGSRTGIGEFFLLLSITAKDTALYIPLSIASGKKPTGFVYHIEGTAEGMISTTDISVRGEGVTQLTLGTILYAKIPVGKTAVFRLLIEMRGKVGKTYGIVINRINYKHNPSDARYQKYLQEIPTKTVKFD